MAVKEQYEKPYVIGGIKTQSDYPSVDLIDHNVGALKVTLGNQAGIEAHAEFLEDFQYPLFKLAHRAFNLLDERDPEVSPGYTEDNYNAFVRGFATQEVITTMVRPPQVYGYEKAVKQLTKTLIDPRSGQDIDQERESESLESMFEPKTSECVTRSVLETLSLIRANKISGTRDLANAAEEVAVRYRTWVDRRPNTAEVVRSIGLVNHETEAQITARLLGAQAANFLQDTSAG